MTYDPYQTVQFGRPAKRKRRAWPWILAAVIGLCAFGGIVTALTGNSTKPVAGKVVAVGDAAASNATTAPAKPSAKAPAKADTTIGAGTWEVGTEIKPGTYTTTAADSCYWARLKGFDGDLDSIITNGNLDPGQHGRLTVKKTDKGLELTGDCEWKLAG